MTYGTGYSLDIRGLLAHLRGQVEGSGVRIVTGAKARVLDGSGEAGYRLTLRGTGEVVVTAGLVIATGGFQGSASKRTAYLGRNADRLMYRSNPVSVGDGLDLAVALGAAASRGMSSFYGHLLARPVRRFSTEEFLPYSQYYSDYSILLNFWGMRLLDERRGDTLLNQELLRQPEAHGILVFDHHVRTTHATAEAFPGLRVLDPSQAGVDAGARHAEAETISGLLDAIASWGVPRTSLESTLDDYARAAGAGGGFAGGAAVSQAARAPQTPPYYAIEVQPSITFTFGGIRIDDAARALDADGSPVPGLFAAGADIGGLSNYGYAGGLAPAYITGRWAGESAAAWASLDTNKVVGATS